MNSIAYRKMYSKRLLYKIYCGLLVTVFVLVSLKIYFRNENNKAVSLLRISSQDNENVPTLYSTKTASSETGKRNEVHTDEEVKEIIDEGTAVEIINNNGPMNDINENHNDIEKEVDVVNLQDESNNNDAVAAYKTNADIMFENTETAKDDTETAKDETEKAKDDTEKVKDDTEKVEDDKFNIEIIKNETDMGNISNEKLENMETLTKLNDFKENNVEDINENECPPIPPNLVGNIQVNTSLIDMREVEVKIGQLLILGGTFFPSCETREWIAIIIPMRNRESQLPVLLNNLHPFLMKQQIKYTIFVVEQTKNRLFNKATLFNVGVVEALKIQNFDCFIFHDVDLLPENDHNLYKCPKYPRHMSVAVDIFNYKLPYEQIFGGVVAIPTDQYKKINGYSNSFWGWGGEDDDIYARIQDQGYQVIRGSEDIGRYTMLKHAPEKPNEERRTLLQTSKQRYKTDGLNNLRYNLTERCQQILYTWFLVDLANV